MTEQLVLIDVDVEERASSGDRWQLDPVTCEIGRRGVARARQALQAARAQAQTATVRSPDLPAVA